MDIDSVKKEDLEYFGYREELPFASCVMIGDWFDMPRLAKIYGLKHGIRWFQANYNLFEVKEDLHRVERDIKELLEKRGKTFVVHLNKECAVAGKKLIKFSKKISKITSKKINKDELVDLLEEYFEYLSSYSVFMLLAAFEKPIMEIAQSLALKKCSKQINAENLLKLITTPSKQTAIEKEQIDFLLLAVKKIKDSTQLAEVHAKKYGWLAIRYFLGKPWTAGDIISRLDNTNAPAAIDNLNRKLLANKLLKKNIAQAIKIFNKKERSFVEMIREVVFLRNQRADFFSEAAFYARPFLSKIAKVMDLTYEELLYLSIEEIISSLRGELNYKKHIESRKRGFIIFHNPERRVIYDGKNFDKYLEKKKFFQMKTAQICEFKGGIAFKGNVRGLVKIVKTEKDLKKVKSHDILVCPMTVPHFIAAMEKASAFITDEGGITCHAAIIARELKKPCIIGTKIATKVLKDGDLVEVDANSGIVRKLS